MAVNDESRFNISKEDPDYYVCPGSKLSLMVLCVLGINSRIEI